ncbi:MAG: domain containing protein, partial [Phycisphaerales bacterium]|nr:domain containing protein [Phycisphaerales bacterium]
MPPTPSPQARPSRGSLVFRGAALCALLALVAVCFWCKGRGYKTRAFQLVNSDYGVHHYPPVPSIIRTRPADRDDNVLPDAFIAADVDLPFAGHVVAGGSLNAASVRLYRSSDRHPIPAVVNTSGAGDAIVLRPMETLEPSTNYTFEVTPEARDTGGHSFKAYKSTFLTAAGTRLGDFPAAFEKVPLPVAAGHMFTCVTIGPGRKLYASTLSGLILRYAINPDGTLSPGDQIETVNTANGALRLITGITFDPACTADKPVLWVSHGQLPPNGEQGQQAIRGADDWTGKISRLTGPDLTEYQDVIVRLPRAAKDHLNNQIVFGPDGAMYFCQAGNTAMGAPDHKWAYRPERLLTAAILRFDVKALKRIALPLDVKTEDDGTYNPFAPGAPLTIYATGVRNSFDLVWHSNGHLYAGINGSAAGGSAPATPTVGASQLPRIDFSQRGPYDGPLVPAIEKVSQTEDDFLFKIEQGAYYGHPNPTRAEYVLNGGNPAGNGPNLYPTRDYPVGTNPDRNWRPAIYTFGKNLSPCGCIEYQSPTFHGALQHKLIFTRFSGGDDLIALTPDQSGDISESITGIEG